MLHPLESQRRLLIDLLNKMPLLIRAIKLASLPWRRRQIRDPSPVMNHPGNTAFPEENGTSPDNNLKDMVTGVCNDREGKTSVLKKCNKVPSATERRFTEFRNKINHPKAHFTREMETFEKNPMEILGRKNTLK